jgi:hypothetical protein
MVENSSSYSYIDLIISFTCTYRTLGGNDHYNNVELPNPSLSFTKLNIIYMLTRNSSANKHNY